MLKEKKVKRGKISVRIRTKKVMVTDGQFEDHWRHKEGKFQ